MASALIQKRPAIIVVLTGSYGLAYADAAILSDYAADRGPHAIPGTGGSALLHYIPGRGWMIEGPAR